MVIFQPRANLRLFRCIAKRLYSHVYKRQNPGFVFRGLLPIVLYRFRISHLSNENNVAFHGDCCIPFPLLSSSTPNIPGRICSGYSVGSYSTLKTTAASNVWVTNKRFPNRPATACFSASIAFSCISVVSTVIS